GEDLRSPDVSGECGRQGHRESSHDACGVHGNVIRFLAPITIQDEVFAEALDTIEASILEARG
ncbi:hypothetical protein, partial [Sinorhizobium meliloti]|uniref:hypothetical protein n=1 Tax=Rhizobium meliloti TaxID=382 RepID=UPI000FE091D2